MNQFLALPLFLHVIYAVTLLVWITTFALGWRALTLRARRTTTALRHALIVAAVSTFIAVIGATVFPVTFTATDSRTITIAGQPNETHLHRFHVDSRWFFAPSAAFNLVVLGLCFVTRARLAPPPL
jgi:hypothetical protein